MESGTNVDDEPIDGWQQTRCVDVGKRGVDDGVIGPSTVSPSETAGAVESRYKHVESISMRKQITVGRGKEKEMVRREVVSQVVWALGV